MKSLIKNKSELGEMRFCYVLLLLFITLLFAFGYRKSILGLNIIFLPLLRIISLYSTLPKLPKSISKIIQSLFILSTIVFYLYIFIWINYYTAEQNEVFVKIFFFEILSIVLFHRYIFFSKHTFLSKYLYPAYKVFKKYCLDIILFLFGLKIFGSTSIYNAFTDWNISLIQIKSLHLLTYICAIYIVIAAIGYIVKKTFYKHIRYCCIKHEKRSRKINECDKL